MLRMMNAPMAHEHAQEPLTDGGETLLASVLETNGSSQSLIEASR
jgi:hypothetical protein